MLAEESEMTDQPKQRARHYTPRWRELFVMASCAASLALLSACSGASSGDGAGKGDKAAEVKVSRPEPKLPKGFELYIGAEGDVREFTVLNPPTGGMIATYSLRAKPEDVVAFYEQVATKQGMVLAGRVSAPDFYNYDGRKEGGSPRTFGATAVAKGEFTNVSLAFDVTP